MTAMHVTKPEAARRQIDCAIRMLFAREDPVAVYTLASAGFRILRDLCEQKGCDGFYKQFISNIRPGMESKFWKAMNKTANFLKHADSDPDAILENISEEVNETTLFMATQLSNDLGQTVTPEMLAVMSYFSALHPEFMLDTNPLKGFFQSFAELREMPRNEQLQFMNAALMLLKAQQHLAPPPARK